MRRARSANAAAGAVAAALVLVAVPAPVAASFPGRNGPLVVELDGSGACFADGGRYLASTPWHRVRLTPITPPCEQTPPEDEDDDPATRSVSAADAAPDGARLLAVQDGAEPRGVVSIAADGSDLRQVVADGEAPAFAPDGRRLAFVRDGAVWTANLDGTDAARIVGDPRCRSDCLRAEDPRWSPDGAYLAIALAPYRIKEGRRPSVGRGIWLVRPRDGRLVRRITTEGTEAEWSPDSRRLVYRSPYHQREIEGGASGGNLYVVRRDGRGRRRVVHRRGTAETSPVWSPDGRWIAWVSLDFGAGDVGFDVRSSLWRVRVAGGRATARPQRVGRLPAVYEEESFYSAPRLTWQPTLE